MSRDGRFTSQLTNGITLVSSDTNIVRIEGGIVKSVGNGKAAVTARFGKQTASITINVTEIEKPSDWSFRNHVQPVLAKAGCNSGACHGAAAGQNGFRLSLRGYDNEGDYITLTRNALGRRVFPSDPGRSLVLLKTTGAVPHKGGKRFEVDSPEYRVLAEWIADGMPGPRKEDPRIDRIEILPERAVLTPGDSHQLLVRAWFTDGHSEDVTRLAKFTAPNASVATVDDYGRVQVVSSGEGAVTAWFLSKIAIGHITVPFTNPVPASVFASLKPRNFIDTEVLEKLRDLNLPPSPRCSDAEFIRRAFLDTLGILPTADEVREFLAKRGKNKRDELIESLLNRPEFVDYWSYKWSDLLLVQSRKLRPAAMWSYYNWIRQQVAANTPWDEFTRRIVTSRGSTIENGNANFYVLHEDPRVMAETTSQAFLGMSINCAKCHNHPMEKWTNDEYFGFANLFARVRMKNGAADGDQIIFAVDQGDVLQPLTGKAQAPKPLDGKPIALEDSADRRTHLSDWLVSRDNPYFGRAIANRVWKNFFGVGLVEAVDDLRITNPASNEKLLTAAANYLADQRFDLKALMRAILRSETYQRSSQPLPENARDTRHYSRYYPRRQMAEVLLDTISQVTGAPTKFAGFPVGWRALQLPDANVDSYFLKTFGRPDRNVTCECERTDEPSVSQVLHLANGDTVNHKLTGKDNRIGQQLAAGASVEAITEEVYLSALSRFPTAAEKERVTKVLGTATEKERRPSVEDLYWAILSSREFLFNH